MKNRITALFLAAVLIICPAVTVFADDASEAPIATVMFASDYQFDYGTLPKRILLDISGTVLKDGKCPDSFVLCGDVTNESGYSNYNASVEGTVKSIVESEAVIKDTFGEDTDYHVFQGNHDPFLPDYMDATGAYEYEDYILYVINTEGYNPWAQGVTQSEEIVRNAAEKLDEYLTEKIADCDHRPVFVATHVPLHFSGRTSSRFGVGDNMYSRYFFDVLNRAGEFLDIVFIFGHNHSKGFDNYLGNGSIFLPRGGLILIPDTTGVTTPYTDKYTRETLNFTYMNAGYVGNIANSESPENADLTATVVEIYEDDMVFSRYGMYGVHVLCGEGHFNTVEQYPDLNVIPTMPGQSFVLGVFPTKPEGVLSERVDSPVSVSRLPVHVHDFVDGVCTGCGIPESYFDEAMPGDTDGDGKITAKDVNILKKVLTGQVEQMPAADLNGDGKISVSDVSLLKRKLSGSL